MLLIGGRGVLRSTDGGNTFSRVRARIVAAARLFNVDRAGGRVFAYGSKNIVASSDRGRTWTKVLRPRKALLASLDFVSARTGFVLGQDGQVFKTRTGGRRWRDLSGVGSDDATGMSFSSASRGYLTLSRFGDDASGYVLRTTDGGRTWRPQLVSSGEPERRGAGRDRRRRRPSCSRTRACCCSRRRAAIAGSRPRSRFAPRAAPSGGGP